MQYAIAHLDQDGNGDSDKNRISLLISRITLSHVLRRQI